MDSENVVHEIKAWINACSKEEQFERIKQFVNGLSKRKAFGSVGINNEKCGYEKVSDIFIEADVPHVKMIKNAT